MKFTFADIIRVLRMAHSLSYGKLSKITGITKTQLFDLEKGNSDNPALKTMLAIAKAYDLTISELLQYLNVPNEK